MSEETFTGSFALGASQPEKDRINATNNRNFFNLIYITSLLSLTLPKAKTLGIQCSLIALCYPYTLRACQKPTRQFFKTDYSPHPKGWEVPSKREG